MPSPKLRLGSVLALSLFLVGTLLWHDVQRKTPADASTLAEPLAWGTPAPSGLQLGVWRTRKAGQPYQFDCLIRNHGTKTVLYLNSRIFDEIEPVWARPVGSVGWKRLALRPSKYKGSNLSGIYNDMPVKPGWKIVERIDFDTQGTKVIAYQMHFPVPESANGSVPNEPIKTVYSKAKKPRSGHRRSPGAPSP